MMQNVRQAAGHEGALEDETRDIFVKRALPKEIAFYQHVQTAISRIPDGLDDEDYEQHPDAPTADLAGVIPVYMGTLSEHDSRSPLAEEIRQRLSGGDGAEIITDRLVPPGQGQETPLSPAETSIVLENLTKRFSRPSVVDIKLGAQLWDEEASPEKQQRMQAVSNTTTSGSLHMRVAGMQIYGANEAQVTEEVPGAAAKDGYVAYGKLYGRALTPADISASLRKHMFPVDHLGHDRAEALISVIIQELLYIRRVLRRIEMRMHSASILIIYESDVDEFDRKLHNQGDDSVGPLYHTKIIDFAHTTLTPGQGPDLDSIEGLSKLISIMKEWEV